MDTWTVWPPDERHGWRVELDSRVTPRGCALEAEVFLEPGGRAWLVWVLETGEVIGVVPSGAA
ncbi:hypothetical protein [Sandaracinus amylolyticus]|uniref:hypothetical protein n=1 Tax=Sandaracinus amylolyticus TaxID=927083 RepID=UPI00069EE1CB|nr:hypothetical protein [Sandaracinus amylolyticus]